MKNFLKREKNFKKEEESLWLDMNLYWKLAVFLIFAGSSAAFFFGYRLFTKINQEPAVFSEIGNSQTETVKKETIEKVLEYFSIRKQKSNEILNSSAPFIDPSL